MTIIFAMMKQQHQEHINQIKESNKQALEMAQQSIKKMAEKMTAMYNSVQAAENYNANPNKEEVRRNQRKQNPMHPKEQKS